ncbi:MAG: flagella basal body P-ring formation protein FlgA [Deltaproteobacteria bacterium]|nr:MAG: flagella basal body P-ring formation protein FlgA [Deltaproteobacteria bacterium]
MNIRKTTTIGIIGLSFLILLGVLQAPPALSGEGEGGRPPYTLTQEYIESIYKDFVYAHMPWPREDVVISCVHTGEVIVIPGSQFAFEVTPPNGSYLGDTVLRVVFRVNGREVRKVRIFGHIDIYREVVCMTRSMRRHEVIREDDLCTARRNISRISDAAISNIREMVGKRLVSSVRAGEIMKQGMVELTPIIKKGDRVAIIADTEMLLIRARGEAMEGGAAGEMIRVRNSKSKKEVYARVIDASTVQVEL